MLSITRQLFSSLYNEGNKVEGFRIMGFSWLWRVLAVYCALILFWDFGAI